MAKTTKTSTSKTKKRAAGDAEMSRSLAAVRAIESRLNDQAQASMIASAIIKLGSAPGPQVSSVYRMDRGDRYDAACRLICEHRPATEIAKEFAPEMKRNGVSARAMIEWCQRLRREVRRLEYDAAASIIESGDLHLLSGSSEEVRQRLLFRMMSIVAKLIEPKNFMGLSANEQHVALRAFMLVFTATEYSANTKRLAAQTDKVRQDVEIRGTDGKSRGQLSPVLVGKINHALRTGEIGEDVAREVFESITKKAGAAA